MASVRADQAGRGGAAGPEPYPALLAAYSAGSAQRFATVGQSGDEIAHVILEAATSEAPHLRYPTSEFARAISGQGSGGPLGRGVLFWKYLTGFFGVGT